MHSTPILSREQLLAEHHHKFRFCATCGATTLILFDRGATRRHDPANGKLIINAWAICSKKGRPIVGRLPRLRETHPGRRMSETFSADWGDPPSGALFYPDKQS